MHGYQFREWEMRPQIRRAIDEYVNNGVPTGDFLRAVIANDLKNAVGLGDDDNLRNLPAIVAYLYWEVPAPCWGSLEAYNRWIDKKGGE